MSDELLKATIEITKAQAAVREMKPGEVQEYLTMTHQTLSVLSGNPTPQPASVTEEESHEIQDAETPVDALKSIKDKQIDCLICGKQFKMLTKKHLATHGLTTEEYLAKYNFPKGTKLVCRKIQKDRRAKMKSMRLWERKGQNNQPES